MSNAVFPTLIGQSWPFVMAPEFSTKVQRAVSGREYRAAYMQYPLYTFTLYYEVLRDAASFEELQELLGFFLARQGSFDNFLFTHPSDNAVVAQNFGTGTVGGQTVFPLIRTYGAGGFTANDLVQNVNAITYIKDAGVTIAQGAGAGKYTIDSLGNVTFGTAPASGDALTWAGSYYYRCRFTKDTQDFSQLMSGLWDISGTGSQGYLQFIGSPQNKV